MWVEYFLVKELHPVDTVVVDNTAFHKSEKTKKIIEKANCNLIFLQAYSPDLNPIETLWANFKANVKNFISKISSLVETIDYVFRKDHLKFE